MKVTEQLFHGFTDWIRENRFPILDRTGEKTVQNELAFYIKQNRPLQTFVELEVNCRALTNSVKTTKREIDIFWEHERTRHAIEIKFHRDPPSSDTGMLGFVEDVRFGEQLIQAGFDSFGALFLTDIGKLYTLPKQPLQIKKNENLNLHHRFRVERCIYGDIRLHVGKLDKTVSLKGRYPLTWREFLDDTKYTFVCLSK